MSETTETNEVIILASHNDYVEKFTGWRYTVERHIAKYDSSGHTRLHCKDKFEIKKEADVQKLVDL